MTENFKKIMVVDDDADLLALIRTFLNQDYRVIEVGNPEEALKRIPAEKPDLIITDVLMPKITGYDFLKTLRRSFPQPPKTPVIVMSSRESMKEYFDVWDIVTFLKKPFAKEALRTAVAAALNEKPVTQVSQSSKPKTEEKPAAPAVYKENPLAVARRAIIAGVDNETVQALKNFLQSVNCQVELGLDEKDVVKVAQKTKPDAIFCQVWEDLRVLDAVALSGQLSANAATQKIPYVAFCISALSSEAGKNLPGRKIIVYTDMLDLLKKTYAFFQQLDQVPA